MRAMLYRRYGGPEVLELAEVPQPVPSAEQVLIRVEASSVNPIDWKRASGAMRVIMPVKFPEVPGYDVAGTIERCGPNVTTFAPGMRVHARIAESSGGASADFALAGLDVVAKMPEGMSMTDAAGLPLAGMTALQGLRDRAKLSLTQSSERVLVIGASGGVGHFAVQIARSAGSFVVGVASARNAELVRGLGANEVIDYAKPDAYAGQAPFDVIFDCVGSSVSPWLRHLTPKGRYASTLPAPALFVRSLFNALTAKQAWPVLLKSRAADLTVLDQLYAAGKLKVAIDSTHRLEALAEAWRRSVSGRAAGKVVLTHT